MKTFPLSQSQKIKLGAAIGILLVLIAAIYLWYTSYFPSTDDAYINANIINIAPQISGPIAELDVQDHQFVKKGQRLFLIDPRPFQIAVEAAQAKYTDIQKNSGRFLSLVQKGVLSTSQGDDVTANLEVAQANLNRALLNLQYTEMTAPADGYLVNFNLRVGTMVSQGQALFALVESSQWWADANFKETDLKRIRVGQSATIVVDIYPDHTFKGVVQGINQGSGAAFSLLPPENATGNWVKVTQRFPVRVNIINPDPRYPLRVGASSTVTVNTW